MAPAAVVGHIHHVKAGFGFHPQVVGVIRQLEAPFHTHRVELELSHGFSIEQQGDRRARPAAAPNIGPAAGPGNWCARNGRLQEHRPIWIEADGQSTLFVRGGTFEDQPTDLRQGGCPVVVLHRIGQPTIEEIEGRRRQIGDRLPGAAGRGAVEPITAVDRRQHRWWLPVHRDFAAVTRLGHQGQRAFRQTDPDQRQGRRFGRTLPVTVPSCQVVGQGAVGQARIGPGRHHVTRFELEPDFGEAAVVAVVTRNPQADGLSLDAQLVAEVVVITVGVEEPQPLAACHLHFEFEVGGRTRCVEVETPQVLRCAKTPFDDQRLVVGIKHRRRPEGAGIAVDHPLPIRQAAEVGGQNVGAGIVNERRRREAQGGAIPIEVITEQIGINDRCPVELDVRPCHQRHEVFRHGRRIVAQQHQLPRIAGCVAVAAASADDETIEAGRERLSGEVGHSICMAVDQDQVARGVFAVQLDFVVVGGYRGVERGGRCGHYRSGPVPARRHHFTLTGRRTLAFVAAHVDRPDLVVVVGVGEVFVVVAQLGFGQHRGRDAIAIAVDVVAGQVSERIGGRLPRQVNGSPIHPERQRGRAVRRQIRFGDLDRLRSRIFADPVGRHRAYFIRTGSAGREGRPPRRRTQRGEGDPVWAANRAVFKTERNHVEIRGFGRQHHGFFEFGAVRGINDHRVGTTGIDDDRRRKIRRRGFVARFVGCGYVINVGAIRQIAIVVVESVDQEGPRRANDRARGIGQLTIAVEVETGEVDGRRVEGPLDADVIDLGIRILGRRSREGQNRGDRFGVVDRHAHRVGRVVGINIAGVEAQLVDPIRVLRQRRIPGRQIVGQNRRAATAEQLPAAELGSNPKLPVLEAAITPSRAFDLEEVGDAISVRRRRDPRNRQTVRNGCFERIRVRRFSSVAGDGPHGVAVNAVGQKLVEVIQLFHRIHGEARAVAVEVISGRRWARPRLPDQRHIALILHGGAQQHRRLQGFGGDTHRDRHFTRVTGPIVGLQGQLVVAIDRQDRPRCQQIVQHLKSAGAEQAGGAFAAAPQMQLPAAQVGVSDRAEHVERLGQDGAIRGFENRNHRRGVVDDQNDPRLDHPVDGVARLEAQRIRTIRELTGIPVEVDLTIRQDAGGHHHLAHDVDKIRRLRRFARRVGEGPLDQVLFGDFAQERHVIFGGIPNLAGRRRLDHHRRRRIVDAETAQQRSAIAGNVGGAVVGEIFPIRLAAELEKLPAGKGTRTRGCFETGYRGGFHLEQIAVWMQLNETADDRQRQTGKRQLERAGDFERWRHRVDGGAQPLLFAV